MPFAVAGIAEMDARIAAIKLRYKATAAVALVEAVDTLTTQPSKEDVPVETAALQQSGRTIGPIEEGDTVTVVSTYGSSTDGTDAYAVKQHEDQSLNHPNGGGPKWLERKGLESAPQIAPAVAAKMRGG